MSTELESQQRMFAESVASLSLPAVPFLRSVSGLGAADGEDKLRRRIELYGSSIRSHQRAALANAYPALLAQVGESYFDRLAIAYAKVHPSRRGDLNQFGANLSAFIEMYETEPGFCYLGDLARLEWSLHLAHFAADPQVLTQQEWMTMLPDDLLDAKLAVHPACELLQSRYAIADLWTACQSDRAFAQDVHAPSYVLVVRPRWRAEILVQCAAAHAAFGALQGGATLNEALEAAFDIDDGFDFTSQWRAWISASAITGLASLSAE